MIVYFKRFKSLWMLVVLFLCVLNAQSQANTKRVKVQAAVGINSPASNGFVEDFEANPVNFPTINLGIQYMSSYRLGAKLDFGHNRFTSLKDTPEFKTNYGRINLQLVYDTSRFTNFLPRMGTFVHAGPGYSFVRPLGDYGENKADFFNTMAGLELHYGINDAFTIYLDGSYIFGFGKEFSPETLGYGSFNGNLLTVSIGASISLSGCYFCNN